MWISRRQFGALASAAVLVRNIPAKAASSDVLVPGWDLPANLDPHLVLDVPAENCAFNLDATRLIVADSPDIWIYNTIELAGMSNRVKGARYCPVGSGCEVRWMTVAG